ncbi:MAG: hypothetical protein Q9169_003372 [Polycauliona sp. 2 TL-2023]
MAFGENSFCYGQTDSISGDVSKYIQNVDNPHDVFKPLLLLGLLANYNKFEFRNPYRLKFEDLVNEPAIPKIILGLGVICSRSRDHYVVVQEDKEQGWTLSNTLKYIGLGVLAPSRSSTPTRNAPTIDDSKDLFSTLPESDACILLSVYDFINANKLFANTFIAHPANSSKGEPPFSAFLSLTSYILHHAYRSPRATLYGHLKLITLRILLEDDSLCTKMFSQDNSTSVRLCRQRPPFLPKTLASRPLAATILDIAIDTITHNLRRRLSVPLYIATLNIIHRLLSHLFKTRTRLPYHWTLLWQTLLSLLRFLTTYADSIKHDPDLPALIDTFLAVLSLAVCNGDVFLPDTDSYDDLFYKIVENGHLLPRFKSAFTHLSRPSMVTPATMDPHASINPSALIDTLVSISNHFTSLLEEEKGKTGTFGSGTKNLSPIEVSKVIRKGCESLRLPETEGLERWVRWREVDEKGFVKKVGRQAVEDARRVQLPILSTPIEELNIDPNRDPRFDDAHNQVDELDHEISAYSNNVGHTSNFSTTASASFASLGDIPEHAAFLKKLQDATTKMFEWARVVDKIVQEAGCKASDCEGLRERGWLRG